MVYIHEKQLQTEQLGVCWLSDKDKTLQTEAYWIKQRPGYLRSQTAILCYHLSSFSSSLASPHLHILLTTLECVPARNPEL